MYLCVPKVIICNKYKIVCLFIESLDFLMVILMETDNHSHFFLQGNGSLYV
jgi:hypothetical protein